MNIEKQTYCILLKVLKNRRKKLNSQKLCNSTKQSNNLPHLDFLHTIVSATAPYTDTYKLCKRRHYTDRHCSDIHCNMVHTHTHKSELTYPNQLTFLHGWKVSVFGEFEGSAIAVAIWSAMLDAVPVRWMEREEMVEQLTDCHQLHVSWTLSARFKP